MARENLETQTQWILVHEGGYVNHPKDPGGATNFGVIQRTYNGYRRRKGLPERSVRDITNAEVIDIYKSQYWDAVKGDMLPSGLDYVMYDCAINSGPARSAKFLQRRLGVKADGMIGNVTLGALAGVNDIESLIKNLCYDRWNWLKTLRTFSTFGRGWTRRVMGDVIGAQPGNDTGVIDRAVKVFNDIPVDPPTEVFAGKANEEDEKLSEVAKETAKDSTVQLTAVAGATPGLLAGAAAVPPGPLQWALAAALLIVVVAGAAIAFRKFR